MSCKFIPVLKLPADLLIDMIITLHEHRDDNVQEKKQAIANLRPNLNLRTLVNAYAIPSLHELRLYNGSLSEGSLTRYGVEIATTALKSRDTADDIIASHIATLDDELVGLLEMLKNSNTEKRLSRIEMINWYIDKKGIVGDSSSNCIDRLGKWLGYLTYFNVLRDDKGRIFFDKRQLSALSEQQQVNVPNNELSQMLLDSYLSISSRLGTRYYIPIEMLRDEIGQRLSKHGFLVTDNVIDKLIIKAAPLLEDHIVSFSPFSGPARYGIKLPSMFAGFITIRPKHRNDI